MFGKGIDEKSFRLLRPPAVEEAIRFAHLAKTAGASVPDALARNAFVRRAWGENRATPRGGQQHFERLVKNFFDALCCAVSDARPAVVPVRRWCNHTRAFPGAGAPRKIKNMVERLLRLLAACA